MRILIVEDKPTDSPLAEKLTSHGFDTVRLTDLDTHLSDALTGRDIDLVILDLDIPEAISSGRLNDHLIAELHRLPLIVMSDHETTPDPIGTHCGTTVDHLVKPFGFDELLARVRLRLQRPTTLPSAVADPPKVLLDPHSRTASVDRTEVELSDQEFDLLDVLMRHRGRVLSRQFLLSHVWGYDFDPGSNVVDVYIGYLRKKLGKDIIRTVRGAGYRFD
ncbi:MAG: response regulator transcription factor [Aeromicrobium sp.]|uniref:response regulator transcription factor n=1 Tax=Aeromicrobium sp. TaxID=1871063 RepID=UPI0039E2B2FA